MKKIEREEVVKKVIGYEANDGTRFNSEEECRKYEDSAAYAIRKQFDKLIVRNKYSDDNGLFSECHIYENFGYGGEEYEMAVIDIKSLEDVKVVDMFVSACCDNTNWKGFNRDYVGKRVLVGLGFCFDKIKTLHVSGTEDELIERFKKNISLFFNPKEENENVD